MPFSVSAGSEGNLESSVVGMMLAKASKAEGCGLVGCTASADWQAFKKDGAYHKTVKAHRVRMGKMEAKSPPGFGGTVKHMKEHHKDISNPFALSWYMHDKGDKSHIKPDKKNVKANMPTTTTKDSDDVMEES